MDEENVKKQLDALATMVEKANELNKTETFGKCEWTDTNGNPRCNSPWSEFQCQQVNGTWTAGKAC